MEQFWARWRREYLVQITLGQKWHGVRRNIKKGDTDLVKNVDLPSTCRVTNGLLVETLKATRMRMVSYSADSQGENAVCRTREQFISLYNLLKTNQTTTVCVIVVFCSLYDY